MSRRNVGKLGPRLCIAFIHHQRDACHCGESRQELGLLVFSCALGWAILRDLLCAEPCRTRNPATFCCANPGPILSKRQEEMLVKWDQGAVHRSGERWRCAVAVREVAVRCERWRCDVTVRCGYLRWRCGRWALKTSRGRLAEWRGRSSRSRLCPLPFSVGVRSHKIYRYQPTWPCTEGPPRGYW